jgi:hypothetical protein
MAIRRERSYQPPFSGSQPQPLAEFNRIHQRWADDLFSALPPGVPNEEPIVRCTRCGVSVDGHTKTPHKPVDPYPDGPYMRCGVCRCSVRHHKAASCTLPGTYVDDSVRPATFGDLGADGRPIHRVNEGQGYCFQCGGCTYYVPLEGALGADWGGCTNPRSPFDRRCVFEHWTCTEFTR